MSESHLFGLLVTDSIHYELGCLLYKDIQDDSVLEENHAIN